MPELKLLEIPIYWIEHNGSNRVSVKLNTLIDKFQSICDEYLSGE